MARPFFFSHRDENVASFTTFSLAASDSIRLTRRETCLDRSRNACLLSRRSDSIADRRSRRRSRLGPWWVPRRKWFHLGRVVDLSFGDPHEPRHSEVRSPF